MKTAVIFLQNLKPAGQAVATILGRILLATVLTFIIVACLALLANVILNPHLFDGTGGVLMMAGIYKVETGKDIADRLQYLVKETDAVVNLINGIGIARQGERGYVDTHLKGPDNYNERQIIIDEANAILYPGRTAKETFLIVLSSMRTPTPARRKNGPETAPNKPTGDILNIEVVL